MKFRSESFSDDPTEDWYGFCCVIRNGSNWSSAIARNNTLINGLTLTLLLASASTAARKGTEGTWSLVTGKTPPREQSNSNVEIKEAVAWACVSGVIVGLTRLAVRRGLANRHSSL